MAVAVAHAVETSAQDLRRSVWLIRRRTRNNTCCGTSSILQRVQQRPLWVPTDTLTTAEPEQQKLVLSDVTVDECLIVLD
jgi:hypothetical protein